MKIEHKVYCHEHNEEITIVDMDIDEAMGNKVTQKMTITYVKPCSQCQAESYKKGIESLLSKGWSEMKGEI